MKEKHEEKEAEYLIRANALAACQTDNIRNPGVQVSSEGTCLPETPSTELPAKNPMPKKKGKQKKTNVVDINLVNPARKSTLQAPAASNPGAQLLRLELQTIFHDFQGSNSLGSEGRDSHLPSSISVLCTRTSNEDSLFSSFSGFDKLICAFSTCPIQLTLSQKILLISSTIRALEAIARVLNAVVVPSSPSLSPSAMKNINSKKTIQTLHLLLTYLLSTCFEVLFPRTTSFSEETIIAQPNIKNKQGKKVGKKEQDLLSGTSAGASNPASTLEDKFPELCTSFERLLGVLTTAILEPAIKSLVLLSHQYFSAAFSVKKQTPSATSSSEAHRIPDIRTDLLSLLRSAFDEISRLLVLDTLPPAGRSRPDACDPCNRGRYTDFLSSVREYLSLTAVRELFKVFEIDSRGEPSLREPTSTRFPPYCTEDTPPLAQFENDIPIRSQESNSKKTQSSKSAPKPASRLLRPRTKEGRIHKLARKDVVWYLCTVLHILFEDACFSDVGDHVLGSRTGSPRSTQTFTVEPNISGLTIPTKSKTCGVTAPPASSASTSMSIPSGNNQTNDGVTDAISAPSKVNNASSTVSQHSTSANVSATEAARSSLSLLRAGLLDSFDALLILVTKCRPAASFPAFQTLSQKRNDSDSTTLTKSPLAATNDPSLSKIGSTSTAVAFGDGNAGNGVKKLGTNTFPDGSEKIMDEVEYDMVLGIIERYWECTLGLTKSVVRT
ncbi:hypothetical protein DFH05DRAFT_1158011 [Lentinula detonsa]|uniref:Uncharacterized protein n=1 Tax=Lentinula detonsa TaxID=2804962 RepID=A0A9W8P0A0_9AGAR|nr:hypothetical protein DFH05DRAFT_1158011 [Lentinula detonsa]